MLKDIVLRQKQEKERLLSLRYIERTKRPSAQKWLDSDLIKVILGPRRAGKSVFSLMLLKELPFMYFNFDDEIMTGDSLNTDELIKELHIIYGDTKTILFDEIQNLPGWELFANRLQRQGYNLIITGSNANLLSRELATALTGRHIPIEILPFDFKEFLLAKNYQIDQEYQNLPQQRGELLNLMEIFLSDGGFPEIVVKALDPKEYLDVLFDSLLFKDVVKRHNVKFPNQIDNLGSYLINNFSNYYSLRKLFNALNFKSVTTTEKYVKYLEEAYVIFSLRRYSFKFGEQIRSPKKVYAVDNGFIGAKATQHSPDKGKLMENSVFGELIKKGWEYNHDLFYYKTRNGREVDFIIKKGNAISNLIQVVYQISSPEVEQREIKGLTEAAEELGNPESLVLTWDEEKEVKKGILTINFVPFWKWLLEINRNG